MDPDRNDPRRTAGSAAHPRPDLTLAHGVDAPDPTDPAEPVTLRAATEELWRTRFDRRSFLARGAIGAGAAITAGLPTTAAATSGPSHHATVDAAALSDALDVGYLRHVTAAVTGFGDTPMGFRPGGSPANLEAVDWIAREMRHVGLRHVARLPVPIDRWTFTGATVAVDGGPMFDGSSWGGVPGTAAEGINAEIIDLGLGLATDYEGVDARGRIVLVDWAYGDLWVNRHGHQATLEGALGIVFYTGATADGAFYNARDDGLLSFDGTYDDDWVPFVFVTRTAANDLRARIAAGTTTVTMTSNVELTRAEDGGIGYNVLGAIPGTDRASEYIIFTGHHDAWFRGAADDATAVAALLGIARSVRATGYRPRRTLLFLASTNEEYGYTDAYHDWLIGAWYAVTEQRPDWRRRAVLTMDFELLGTGDPGERLLVRTHSELLDHAVDKLESDPDRTPYGTDWQNTVWANADHFTLTAAGIPGIYFNTVGTGYLTRNYHTNFDVLENVSIGYLAQNIAVVNDIWVDHDRATLPLLDFVTRAVEAEERTSFVVDGTGIRSLPGVDQAAQDALERAVAVFRAAAEDLDDRLETGRVRSRRRVGQAMMRAERRILRNLVALDVFNQYVFPHQQLQRDATRMQAAIDALRAGDPATALDAVQRTGLTNAGRHFAYEVYAAELARHDRSFDRLQWGAQAHLPPFVDLWHEYRALARGVDAGMTDPGDYGPEIASIGTKLDPAYDQLNHRLRAIAGVLRTAAAELHLARRLAG